MYKTGKRILAILLTLGIVLCGAFVSMADTADYRAYIGKTGIAEKRYYTSLQEAVDAYTNEDYEEGLWTNLLSDNSEIITVDRRITLLLESFGHYMNPEDITVGEGFRMVNRGMYGSYVLSVSDLTVSGQAEGIGGNVTGDTKYYFSGRVDISTETDSSGSAVLKAKGEDGTYLEDPCEFTAVPAENFEFEKWAYSINGVEKLDILPEQIPEEDIDGNIVFIAHFTGLPVTVRFEAGGGTPVSEPHEVIAGELVEEPAAPSKAGYTFGGWYADSSCTRAWDFETDIVTANTTLYAKWEAEGKPAAAHTRKYADNDDNAYNLLFTGTWGNPVKNGTWTQDADGIWHYSTTRAFRAVWGYIANPYAAEEQNSADWFWFDENGNMCTGWQFINGKWYYLNPSSDGTLGACLIGPGKTPDGYEIDESGAWTGR